MDFWAGWKVFLCDLAMCLGSGLWETACLTSAAYAANALAVWVNAFWIHRLFTFSLNVDLLSASVGNLTQEVIGQAICPKKLWEFLILNQKRRSGTSSPCVQPLPNYWRAPWISSLGPDPSGAVWAHVDSAEETCETSMANIPSQWWLLQTSIFPAPSSSAVIYSPFWQISWAPVRRPLHGPCSSGSSKQHESMGTPSSCQHCLQVNTSPCVSHRPENGVITGLIGSPFFLKSSGADFSTLSRVQIFLL